MKTKLKLLVVCHLLSAICLSAAAQGTAFTYQGRLNNNGATANGSYDLQFSVFDATAGGFQIGATLTTNALPISNGLFTVTLDFGNQFPGANRWLEIAVRTNSGGAFTALTGRQRITPTPYAITASNLSGTLSAGQLSGNIGSANLAGTYANALILNNAANSFSGTGAGLTSLNAGSLTGTVPDARLSANVALLTGSQTFTGAKSFNSPVTIANPADLSFGATTRQMLNLWGTNYGIGVQNNTLYARSDGGFAWFKKGGHASNPFDPGLGGTNLMWVNPSGDLYANGSVSVDTVNANNGSYYPGLVFGYGSGETIASQRGTNGSNRYGLDFYTGFQPRLSITGNGNVGIGTNAPGAKLDVNGTIRAGGGVMFPDGSIQTRAAAGATAPSTASGYTPGTTVSVTLNGSPCSLTGALTFQRGGGQELENATVQVQRVRPVGDSDWEKSFRNIAVQKISTSIASNWFTLVVSITQPGGASQSLTASNFIVRNYTLRGKDGQLMEVADMVATDIFSTPPLWRSGTIPNSTPSADIPGLLVLTNGVAMPGVTLANLSVRGHPTFQGIGAVYGNVQSINLENLNNMTLRANLSAGTGLFNRFVGNNPNNTLTFAVQKNGVTLMGLGGAYGSEYRLRLADDGLPIEEMDVSYQNVTLP